MDVLNFAGGYQDQRGQEVIRWRVEGTDRYKDPSFDVITTIRGVDLLGSSFDDLKPVDSAVGAVQLPLDQAGMLTDCILSGDLPCTLAIGGQHRPVTITFTLDQRASTLRRHGRPGAFDLSLLLDGEIYRVTGGDFENVQGLESVLPPGARLVCCFTCLFSDYSPLGHGLIGIRCHRGAKDQYLAVQTKKAYWGVPVTEEVPETYLCSEYQRRVPGTGYRG